MAINDISQYFTLDNGTQIANDNTFASLAANTRIKNKNSGSTFIKNSNYSNVFDRVSTFAEFIKATDFKITSSGSGNGVASISYTPSTRTVTQTLTTFATPAELNTASNNLKSQAVGSISVSGRTVTYKNINGQTLGSFQTQDNNTTYSAGTGLSLNGTQFNVTRSNGSSNLWWNTEVTLGTVAGLAIKARMPALTKSDVIGALGFNPADTQMPSGAFDIGSTIFVAIGYETNLNYGVIIPGGYFHGWCPDDGGGALSDVIHIPGTWVCCVGPGNNSNVRGAIIRRIA